MLRALPPQTCDRDRHLNQAFHTGNREPGPASHTGASELGRQNLGPAAQIKRSRRLGECGCSALGTGTETLDITASIGIPAPAPRPRGRTLAQGPKLGAQPFRLPWGDAGDRSRIGTRSGPCCPMAHTEPRAMQAVRSSLPALFAWHWCICAAQAMVTGSQGTGTLFFSHLSN